METRKPSVGIVHVWATFPDADARGPMLLASMRASGPPGQPWMPRPKGGAFSGVR